MRENLAAKEYWITWQNWTQLDDLPAAWHAPNRVQDVRTYFTPEGIRLIPRGAGTPAWEWGLSLVEYGRGGTSHLVQQASLFPDENRIRLDRQGIEEWFVNGPWGVKHGFVLYSPPDDGQEGRIGGAQAVHLDLTIGGSLTPVVGTDGRSVRFVGPSGMGEVYYGSLEVRDALDRALPAWMEVCLASDVWMIRLLVDDREAAYPIEINPVATTAAWTGEIDQDGASYGISVGTAGDVNGDGYDDVIVGAWDYDNGQTNEGAAFLYLGSDSGPSTTYVWMVESDNAAAGTGRSVGTAGDVDNDGYDDVIVGVPNINNAGQAWVFHGSPTGPSAVADWVVQSDQAGSSFFGFSVGTAGDVNGDGYDDVIIGSHLYNSPGFIQDGRAYVFHGSEHGLSMEPDWITAGNQSNSNYGISVGTAGDVNADGYDDVIVGAYRFDNVETDEGRVFVFHGSASGVSTEPDWTYENDVAEACLGGRVGTAGDVNADGYDDVIVGAAYLSCINVPSSPLGRAYTFHGSPAGLPSLPTWVVELVQTGAAFGKVATAGDVNDDGYDDVVVGASYYDNDQMDEGAAFLYLGSGAGLTTEHAWMVEGNQTDTRFGFGTATAGDVNGDGADDVILGAYFYDNVEIDEGAAFVYLGSTAVVPAGRIPFQTPLLLNKTLGSGVRLTWGPSCLEGDSDYEIYEGELGDFANHTPLVCSTDGARGVVILPSDGSMYYLIVPRNTSWEGSYGRTSNDFERPRGAPSCLPQAVGECE